ncbi:hypothetical protein [Nocardioides sp. R-C-SC26]|uniref:hypothetical protein n=1 Tax=Nocardioides sp. R-C-SC26 TaxID=2870414 RepID=UPI001E57D52C|nr:hypothetical protein [Nocardioides sp. R-C-SC26]
MASTSATDLAARLLDAQVAWIVERLTGPDLPGLIEQDVDDLLALGGRITVGGLVDADAVSALVREALTSLPPSAAASTAVSVAAAVAHEGPEEPVSLTDLVDRDHVEALTNEALRLVSVLETVMDELAESPLVAGLAARFVGRLVTEVLAANRAVAEKLPGVGSLVSLGASIGASAAGAAGKQLEGLLGDTAGKGATIAMRRLNKIVVETLRDPATRAAVLEVFDTYGDQPLPPLSTVTTRDDVERVAGLVQDLLIGAAPTAPVTALADALVRGFLDAYGDHPVSTLVEDLGLTRDDVVRHARALVPRALEAAAATGELDAVVRTRLEPFFASAEVAQILGRT